MSDVIIISGQPTPIKSLFAPVTFAIIKSMSLCHAITASTINSGTTWSSATIATANPWLILNSAASAAQLIRSAEVITALKHKKEITPAKFDGYTRSHKDTATVYKDINKK